MNKILSCIWCLILLSCSFNSFADGEACTPVPDLSGFEIIDGDLTFAAQENGSGDIYVYGSVTFENNSGNNTTTYDGSIYATGDIYVGRKVTVTGFAYAEGVFSQHNQGNVQVLEGSCSEGDKIPPIDLPVDELIGQCTDIFKDAAQSYSGGELTIWSPAYIDDDVTAFDFGSHQSSSGTCGAGIACSSTGDSSAQLSAFSIPDIEGQDINAYSWNSVSHITLGVETEDTDNGEYSGTIFGDLQINSSTTGGASITFVERSAPLTDYYVINSIDFANSNAVLNLSPGVYAVNTFTAPAGGTINVIGDGEVYLFIEDTPNQMSLTVEADPTSFHFISNDNNDTQLSSNTNIDGSIYFNGDLTMSGATVNGRVAVQDLTMNSSASITNDAVCGDAPSDDYTFTFDGTQPQALTCEAHSVLIQARINGAINEDYTNSITISSSSGLGDWSIGSANGSLDNGTAGDGIATYQFVDSDDGQIELYLSHLVAGDVTVNVTNSDASADTLLNFSAAVLKTELSCVSDSLGVCINTANLPFSMTLTAVKEDEQTQECVNYNPNGIAFWSEYVSPTSPTGLAVEVNEQQIGNGESNATQQVVTFVNGVATLAVNYPDAGRIAIHAQDVDSTDIQGEAESIVNPVQLLIDNISSSTGNSNPETTDSGEGFMRASVADYNNLVVDTFQLTVSALKDCSNDTQGHCSGSYGQRTPSFASEIELSNSLVFPTDGSLGSLQYDGDNGLVVDMTGGQFSYENLAYDEVGTIAVTASTTDGYLVTNNTIATTDSQNIGRFYPDYLAYDSFNVTPACNDDFTYIGQTAIEVNYNIKAYAQGDSTITENYDYSLGYPVAGSELLSDQSDNFADQVFDKTPLEFTDRLLPADYYDNSLWSAGQFNVIAQQMGIAKTTSPDGPYFSDSNSMDYYIQLSGLDGEKLQTDSATTCAGDSCYLGSLGDLVYGRLLAGNGHGSEYQSVRTDISAYYFDGDKFTTFSADQCTTLAMSQISSDPSKNVSNQITVSDPVAGTSGQTTVSIINSPLIDGNSQLNFSAPSSHGSLDYYIEIDSVTPWLLDSGNAVTCPEETGILKECISGYVEFGLYRGNDRIIYRLQTFN